MRMKRLIFPMLVLIMLFTYGCNINSSNITPPSSKNSSTKSNKSNINSSISSDPIQQKINTMTLDEKIGQLVIAGVDDFSNNEHSKTLINTYHVGGFILFKQNIDNTNQTINLLNSLKQTNSNSRVPLFLGVDEEGGRVSRLPSELKKLPPNKSIGKINNTSFSNKIGQVLGEELNSFGFNVDFAPVLDINSNPLNPIIGDRSFGRNSFMVSKLGIATMNGIQSKNVIPVIKHFPGHGDTSVDSHIGLPIVNNDLKRLNALELVPFSNAIKSGADMVMVAHILLPKIDSQNPASFSKVIITDILRKSLKFNGVVITDDMTMGAIVKNYNIDDAAVKSLNAGTDIILVCHDFEKQTSVLNAIKNAASKGTISQTAINGKVYRILKLKQKYNLKDSPNPSFSVENINHKISKLLNAYM
ncbi:glycoside hydrolase family 3 [Clostridium sp. TW13]|uniref:Glycoside hydrolase family 3 n=1 Tax=Inconstantimicrobium mannanitabidum TaxID=1604901 RepID=A0ACB5R9C5_9CLOT|nr:glycoside hydrolase family 3 [Clostridium sp. TW13]